MSGNNTEYTDATFHCNTMLNYYLSKLFWLLCLITYYHFSTFIFASRLRLLQRVMASKNKKQRKAIQLHTYKDLLRLDCVVAVVLTSTGVSWPAEAVCLSLSSLSLSCLSRSCLSLSCRSRSCCSNLCCSNLCPNKHICQQQIRVNTLIINQWMNRVRQMKLKVIIFHLLLTVRYSRE